MTGFEMCYVNINLLNYSLLNNGHILPCPISLGERRSLELTETFVSGRQMRQEIQPKPCFDSCNCVVKHKHSVSLKGSKLPLQTKCISNYGLHD